MQNVLFKEEQTDTYYGDESANYRLPRDLLMEEPIRRQEDDDWCHCHQRRSDTCCRLLHRHQREADSHKGAEDGGSHRYRKSLFIVHRLAQMSHFIAII